MQVDNFSTNYLLNKTGTKEVYNAECATSKAVAFEWIVGGIFNECFPLKTYRIRSDDSPWITHGIRKKIEQGKEMYRTDKK